MGGVVVTLPPSPVHMKCQRCGHRWKDWLRTVSPWDRELRDNDEYMEQCSTCVCPKCGLVHRAEMLEVEADNDMHVGPPPDSDGGEA